MSPALPAGYKLDPFPSMPDAASGLPAGYKLDAGSVGAPPAGAPPAAKPPTMLETLGNVAKVAMTGDKTASDRIQQSTMWNDLGGKGLSNFLKVAFTGDQDAADQVTQSVKGVVNGLRGEPARVWSQLSASGQAMLAGQLGDATYHLAGAVPLVGAGAQVVADAAAKGNWDEAAQHAAMLLLPFALGGAGNVDAAGEMAANAVDAVPSAAKATAAGLKAAAPDAAKGLAKIGAGQVIGHMTGMEWPMRLAMTLPGIGDLKAAWKTGMEAGKSAIAPAEEAAEAAPAGVPATGPVNVALPAQDLPPVPPPAPPAGPVPTNRPLVPPPAAPPARPIAPVSTVLPAQDLPAVPPPAPPAGPVPTNRPLAASGTAIPAGVQPTYTPPAGRVAPINQGYSAPAPAVNGALPGEPPEVTAMRQRMQPASGSANGAPAPPAGDAQLLDAIAHSLAGQRFAKLSAARQATVRKVAAQMEATEPSGPPPPQTAPPASQAPAAAPIAEEPKIISMKNLKQEAANSGRPVGEVVNQYRQEGWRIEYDPFYNTLRNRRGKLPPTAQ
jgi:hypothetical protein